MLVYHGAKEEYGLQILKSGIIVASGNNGRSYGKVTEGYCYVTKKMGQALRYGTYRESIENRWKRPVPFYIFKIDIPDELLLFDIDEENQMVYSDDKIVHSYRIKGCIKLKDFKWSYAKIENDKDGGELKPTILSQIESAGFGFRKELDELAESFNECIYWIEGENELEP